MPDITLSIVPTTDRLPNTDGRVTDGGMLFGLSAILTDGTAKTGRCHVQAGVFSGSAVNARIITCLLDDYVYDGHIPSWTGRFPIEPNEGVFATVRSADAVTVRIVGRVLKRDP